MTMPGMTQGLTLEKNETLAEYGSDKLAQQIEKMGDSYSSFVWTGQVVLDLVSLFLCFRSTWIGLCYKLPDKGISIVTDLS